MQHTAETSKFAINAVSVFTVTGTLSDLLLLLATFQPMLTKHRLKATSQPSKGWHKRTTTHTLSDSMFITDQRLPSYEHRHGIAAKTYRDITANIFY